MLWLGHTIDCKSREDRVEIFPFYDTHIGKSNCCETGIKKQVKEIVRRSNMPNRHVIVIHGGDMIDCIKPQDIRFDYNGIADWFVEGDAVSIKGKLNDIAVAQIERANMLFNPIKHLMIGIIEGNHERTARRRYNCDIYKQLCAKLDTKQLTDECAIRFTCVRKNRAIRRFIIYLRHGYGGGRTVGAEPNKLAALRDEWECADVCISGHSHSFSVLPPKPVFHLPIRGSMDNPPMTRYRYAANPGAWLESHKVGPGTYESNNCYPAKPMVTCKIVVWPFWHTTRNNIDAGFPKIEIREYTIL